MVTKVKKIARLVFESGIYGHALLLMDAMMVYLWKAINRRPVKQTGLVLIAAPGAGNIGDQALLESALDNYAGPVIVVARTKESVSIPDRHAWHVEVHALPRLIYGNPISRYVDFWQFCSLARVRTDAWIVGADVMDGAYNPLGSLSRISCSLAAAKLGCDTRILGFSWNTHSTRSARIYAASASKSVKLFARDPRSLLRLQAEGIEAALSADIVFARAGSGVSAHPAISWIDEQRTLGKKVLIVNASGLLASAVDQPREIESFVKNISRDDWCVVLLPHVVRPGNDDLAVLDKVNLIDGHSLLRIQELLTPDDVFALVRRVDVVVTGRMHLAVLATLAGRFSITLASQGKVEGLYKLLDMVEHCVSPEIGYGQVIGQLVRELAQDGRLESGLPHTSVQSLVELSMKNFAEL